MEALAYFPRTLFGLHWDALDSYAPGLRDLAIASVPPGALMVGIDERTAIVGDGREFRVEGRSGVSLIRPGEPEVRVPSGASFSLTEEGAGFRLGSPD